MLTIRSEEPDDRRAVREVNLEAFGRTLEADLVDALRERAAPIVSLVAVEQDVVVGHILFTPVSVATPPHAIVMGLAPMAVRSQRQRRGVGSALVRHGLERCRDLGACAAVVLGHAQYYPRFGFAPASTFGLTCEYDVPDEVFLAIELVPGALGEASGLVRYHEAFQELPESS